MNKSLSILVIGLSYYFLYILAEECDLHWVSLFPGDSGKSVPGGGPLSMSSFWHSSFEVFLVMVFRFCCHRGFFKICSSHQNHCLKKGKGFYLTFLMPCLWFTFFIHLLLLLLLLITHGGSSYRQTDASASPHVYYLGSSRQLATCQLMPLLSHMCTVWGLADRWLVGPVHKSCTSCFYYKMYFMCFVNVGVVVLIFSSFPYSIPFYFKLSLYL